MITGLVGIFAGIIFYHVIFISGLDQIPGDIGDTTFNRIILEHWFRVACGLESWNSPNFFFPISGALGYSDALVLLAVPYVFARTIGISLFHATQLTFFFWSLVGFFGMFVWLHYLLRLKRLAALSGSVIFSFGTALYQGLACGSVQLMAVLSVPWFAYFIGRSLQADKFWKNIFFAVMAAFLLAAILLTSFYIGWFLILQSLIGITLLFFILIIHEGIKKGSLLIQKKLIEIWPFLFVGTIFFLIALLPFAWLYGPILQQGIDRDISVVIRYLPHGWDLFYAQGNALWGFIAEALVPELLNQKDELGKGLTGGLLGLFFTTFIYIGWRPHFFTIHLRWVAYFLGGSVLICWAFMLKIEAFSFWSWVYVWIPGAIAIRTPHRFNIVLSFSVTTLAAIGIDTLKRNFSYFSKNSALLLGLFLALEQINISPRVVHEQEELKPIVILPAPQPECKVFVLVPSDQDSRWHRWTHQLLGVVIAQKFNIPTINGESGHFPPGWYLSDPISPDYETAVRAWVDRYQLWDGLCGLDPQPVARWFPIHTTAMP